MGISNISGTAYRIKRKSNGIIQWDRESDVQLTRRQNMPAAVAFSTAATTVTTTNNNTLLQVLPDLLPPLLLQYLHIRVTRMKVKIWQNIKR